MRIARATALSMLIITATYAGSKEMKISKSITRTAEFGEAKAEAIKKKKPIVIVYSDEKTTKEDIIDATKTIIKKLKPVSALVFTNKEDYNTLPKEAQAAFNSGGGSALPKTVILYPNLFDVVAVLPAVTDDKKLDAALKVVKDRIKAASEKMRDKAAKLKAARDKADADVNRRLGP